MERKDQRVLCCTSSELDNKKTLLEIHELFFFAKKLKKQKNKKNKNWKFTNSSLHQRRRRRRQQRKRIQEALNHAQQNNTNT
jgi:hypothetical protein